MNEIFEFHKKLNIHKIIFIVIISLFILVVLIEIISNLLDKNNTNKTIVTTETFYDEKKSLSIALPSTYNLEKNTSDNYLIELKSPQALKILISKKDIITGRKLSDIVFADRNSYTKNFQKISNVSEISSISVNKDLESYIYSFDHLENEQKFNLKIIWIETENGYYVIDINFPSNLSDNFSNLIKEITSSFTLYW